jgi:hypothetical protein
MLFVEVQQTQITTTVKQQHQCTAAIEESVQYQEESKNIRSMIERNILEEVDCGGGKRIRTTEHEISTTYAEIVSTKFNRRIETVITDIISKTVSEVKEFRMDWSGGSYRRKNNGRLKRLRAEHAHVFAVLEKPISVLVAEELRIGFCCLERARAMQARVPFAEGIDAAMRPGDVFKKRSKEARDLIHFLFAVTDSFKDTAPVLYQVLRDRQYEFILALVDPLMNDRDDYYCNKFPYENTDTTTKKAAEALNRNIDLPSPIHKRRMYQLLTDDSMRFGTKDHCFILNMVSDFLSSKESINSNIIVTQVVQSYLTKKLLSAKLHEDDLKFHFDIDAETNLFAFCITPRWSANKEHCRVFQDEFDNNSNIGQFSMVIDDYMGFEPVDCRHKTLVPVDHVGMFFNNDVGNLNLHLEAPLVADLFGCIKQLSLGAFTKHAKQTAIKKMAPFTLTNLLPLIEEQGFRPNKDQGSWDNIGVLLRENPTLATEYHLLMEHRWEESDEYKKAKATKEAARKGKADAEEFRAACRMSRE